jgi:protoheme IX farnesyltransferase
LTSIAVAAVPRRAVATARDYLALSKSRIVMMVLITTAAGFLFAPGSVQPLLLLHTLVGTALVAAGTNALNQYVEREHDARMRRTLDRPLPAGRITPRAALLFSTFIAVAGTLYLALVVNALTAVLGAFTLTSYIFVYTPLKRHSTICTIIGAVPGAIPPLMGWTAATGVISTAGVILFAILFLWQLPHFMAISWIYREDYERGGFVMLSVLDRDGAEVARQAVFFVLALLPVSLLPVLFGMAGAGYAATATVAGALFLAAAIGFFFDRNPRKAMRLFMVSNIYLVAMMLALVLA